MLEITVGHWPFSANFSIWPTKFHFGQPNLPCISYGTAINNLQNVPSSKKQLANFDSYFCTAAWQDELAVASSCRYVYVCVHPVIRCKLYQMTALLRVIHFVTGEKYVAMHVVTLLLKIATC